MADQDFVAFLEEIFGEAESLIRRRLEERDRPPAWSAPYHRTERSYCATSTRNVLQSVRTRRVWPVT